MTITRVQQILLDFEKQVDDVTGLSDTEELMVLNRVVQKICKIPFEFLKVNKTGSITTSGGVSYIDIPADFQFFTTNSGYTENYQSNDTGKAKKVIFIGSNYVPYEIINYSDRRQYRNQGGFCYIDFAANKIYFTLTPTEGTTYDFDYCKVHSKLTTADAPLWPERFDDVVVYGMSVENDIIEKSPKAKAYTKENQSFYVNRLADMKSWNNKLLNY